MLQFSALKKIDRVSCSIMLPKKGRESRVTLCGDKSYFYEAEDYGTSKNRESQLYTPHYIREKYIEIDQEL